MLRIQYCSLIALLLVYLGAQAAAQCPPAVNGVSYPNLPKLTNSGDQNNDWSLVGSDGFTYTWNICAAESLCDCGVTGTVACQYQTSCGNSPKSLGILSSQNITTVAGINSVNFLYGGGSFSQGCGVNRNSNISVACSNVPGTTAIAVNANGCYYSILMSSSNACAAKSQTKSPSKGLSGGSIFLITVSCVFVAYMICGALYMWHYNQASGWELCPNREFWIEFGDLIKTGALFTWGKITGSEPNTSYENVE